MKRASYKSAVRWLALHGRPGDDIAEDPCINLIAYTFERAATEIVRDVKKDRAAMGAQSIRRDGL